MSGLRSKFFSDDKEKFAVVLYVLQEFLTQSAGKFAARRTLSGYENKFYNLSSSFRNVLRSYCYAMPVFGFALTFSAGHIKVRIRTISVIVPIRIFVKDFLKIQQMKAAFEADHSYRKGIDLFGKL